MKNQKHLLMISGMRYSMPWESFKCFRHGEFPPVQVYKIQIESSNCSQNLNLSFCSFIISILILIIYHSSQDATSSKEEFNPHNKPFQKSEENTILQYESTDFHKKNTSHKNKHINWSGEENLITTIERERLITSRHLLERILLSTQTFSSSELQKSNERSWKRNLKTKALKAHPLKTEYMLLSAEEISRWHSKLFLSFHRNTSMFSQKLFCYHLNIIAEGKTTLLE